MGKDNFSATFLQVLDENGQVETANIVRRALGLKEKPTYKDDQNTGVLRVTSN